LQSQGSTATWASTATLKVGQAVYSDQEYITQLTIGTSPPTRYLTMVVGAGGYAGLGAATGLAYDVSTNILTSGGVALTNSTASISTSSGALTVVGGVGIGGDVWIGGTLNVAYVNTATNLKGGTVGQVPYQTAPGVTSFYGPGTLGNVLVSGGTGSPTYQNTLTLAGTTAATSTQTGALVVAGGVGVGGNLYVGGEIVAQRLTIEYTTVTTTLVTTDDVIKTSNTTPAYSSTSGALIVSGGVGIGGDLWVGGTVYTLNAVIGTAVNLAGGSTGTLAFQSATSSTAFVNAGSSGQILVSRGANASGPNFVNTNTFMVGYANTALNVATANNANIATTATNIAGGTVNQIPYQTSTGVTLFFGPGTDGQLLISKGTAAGGPTFVNTNTFIVGYANTALNVANAGAALTANTATNLAGGTAGQVPYQTGPGQTSFFGAGTAGNVLVSNGTTSPPTYNNTLTLVSVTSATSTSTGAFQVRGGAAVGLDLYVGGDIYGLKEITAFYGTPSDIRLKTNVELIDNGLAKVISLSGITYDWNELAGNRHGGLREVGVIAQEIQKVLPEAVIEKDDGYLTVKYDRIIPLLIQAIKELSNEVEELKKKIK
jgi:hypothetical protein